eukprot:scaffold1024_cov43-Prasinocladus_malaysianus.AAC.1
MQRQSLALGWPCVVHPEGLIALTTTRTYASRTSYNVCIVLVVYIDWADMQGHKIMQHYNL